MALPSRGSDNERITLRQAEVLVDSYTPERYARELPDNLLFDLAKAPILSEEEIDVWDNRQRFLARSNKKRNSNHKSRKSRLQHKRHIQRT